MRYNVSLLSVVAVAAGLFFVGCTRNEETAKSVQRTARTIEKTVSQTIAPTGEIVQLTTTRTTITDEGTGETISAHTETTAPQVVGAIGKLAGVAAGVVGGPTASAVVEKGIGWLEAMIGGGGLAATTAATGYVATRRKRAVDEAKEEIDRIARQRNELIDGIERSKSELGEHWDTLTQHLEAEQSHDTKAVIRDRVG